MTWDASTGASESCLLLSTLYYSKRGIEIPCYSTDPHAQRATLEISNHHFPVIHSTLHCRHHHTAIPIIYRLNWATLPIFTNPQVPSLATSSHQTSSKPHPILPSLISTPSHFLSPPNPTFPTYTPSTSRLRALTLHPSSRLPNAPTPPHIPQTPSTHSKPNNHNEHPTNAAAHTSSLAFACAQAARRGAAEWLFSAGATRWFFGFVSQQALDLSYCLFQ